VDLNEFVSKMDSPRETPSGISARCRSHDDTVSSLSINAGDHGGIVVKCHAGCTIEELLAAYGMTIADVMGQPYVQATYPYVDKANRLLWTVQRWANPKTFRVDPFLPPPSERVLFQVPAIEYARHMSETLFIVEGEKDALRLADLNIPATCNVGGAGKWLPHYSETLAGLNLVIVADNDAPGRAHAREVALAVKPFAKTVTMMCSPYGKDLSDLLDAGYTVDALQLLPDEEGMGAFVAASVKTRKVEWAWAKRFPLGKVSIIEGDPGDGKSVLTVDLVARWSSGSPMPDGSDGVGPVNVVMISAEDDMEDTIVPRLRRAGANLENVLLIAWGSRPDIPFDIAENLPELRRQILARNAKIVIVDPLSAFMPEKADTHNDASTRRALQPLKVLASQTGAAIVCVRHLTKGSAGGKAMYRGGGSIAFIGAARAAYLVAPSHTNPDVKVLACVKNNLARKPSSLTYTVEIAEDEQPFLVWGEALAQTAQELLDGPTKEDEDNDNDELRGKRRARQEERVFLVELLDANGPLSWVDVVAAGKEEGYSQMTLVRARSEVMSIESYKHTEDGVTRTLWRRKPNFLDGQSTTESEPAPPTLSLSHSGKPQTGAPGSEQVNKLSKLPDAALLPDGTTEDLRDSQLDELPLLCDQCGSTEAHRFGKPWWVVRCLPHNPRTYGSGPL
jgi:putative DNA primase/helicase